MITMIAKKFELKIELIAKLIQKFKQLPLKSSKSIKVALM